MENKDRYVTYHQALGLKVLGFDEPCDTFYDSHFNFWEYNKNDKIDRNTNGHCTPSCSAPTIIQAANWLVEKKGWDFNTKPDFTKYGYKPNHKFDTLESTLSATIDVAIIELQIQQILSEL